MHLTPLFCFAISVWGQRKFVTEDDDGVEFIVSEELIDEEVITEEPTEIVTAFPTSTQELAVASLASDVPSFLPEAVQVPEAINQAILCGKTEWPEEQEGYFRSCEEEGEDVERVVYGITTTIETTVNVTSTETGTTLTTISTLGAAEPTPVDGDDHTSSDDTDEGTDLGESELPSEEERVLTITSTAVKDAANHKDREGTEASEDDGSDSRLAHACSLGTFYPVIVASVWLAR